MKGYEHTVRKYQKTDKYKLLKRCELKAMRIIKNRYKREFKKVYEELKEKEQKDE